MIATLAAIGGILLGLVVGCWAGWQWRGAVAVIEAASDDCGYDDAAELVGPSYDERYNAEAAARLGTPLHDYTPRGEAL